MATFDATRRSFVEMQAQQRFGTNWYSLQNRQFSSYPSWIIRPFNGLPHHNAVARAFPLASNHAMTTASGDTFFKGYGPLDGQIQQLTYTKQKLPVVETGAPPAVAGITSGTTSPIALNKPLQSQMTIFYGGRVNVFDNIPIEKAQEIMFLAANGSKISFNTAHMKIQAPAAMPSEKVVGINHIDLNQNPAGTIGNEMYRSNPPSPESVTSHPVTFPSRQFNDPDSALVRDFAGSSSSNGRITAAGRSDGPSLKPRAVPMARKASLARFMERRKERISNKAPYLSGQNPMLFCMKPDGDIYSGKSMESGISFSHDANPIWCLGMSRETTCVVRSS